MFGSMYNENTYNAPWAISRRLEGQSDVRLQPSGELLRLRYYNGDSEIEIVNVGDLYVWHALKGLSKQNLTSASSLNRNRGLNGFATIELKSEGFACADRSIRGSYSIIVLENFALASVFSEFAGLSSVRLLSDGTIVIYNPAVWMEKGERLGWRQLSTGKQRLHWR